MYEMKAYTQIPETIPLDKIKIPEQNQSPAPRETPTGQFARHLGIGICFLGHGKRPLCYSLEKPQARVGLSLGIERDPNLSLQAL